MSLFAIFLSNAWHFSDLSCKMRGAYLWQDPQNHLSTKKLFPDVEGYAEVFDFFVGDRMKFAHRCCHDK